MSARVLFEDTRAGDATKGAFLKMGVFSGSVGAGLGMVYRAGLRLVIAGVAAGGLYAASASAETIDVNAREAILVDMNTNTVLFEKNADEHMPTSSMSKMITIYEVFKRLKAGKLSMDDKLPVSEKAWRMQGSKMFVELGNSIRVEDLIRGVLIQSGNDATVVLAEGIAGSEDAFADLLNKDAAELGMKNSHFMNASGWPDPDHYSTARDLSILAMALVRQFPEYFHFFSEPEFTYHGIRQRNRNPLLFEGIGADGMKTGHTEIAGYGLTATVERDGRRLMMVMNGLQSERARAEEPAKLLEWGFREFKIIHPFKPGAPVGTAKVWMGKQDEVPLVAAQDVSLTVRRGSLDDVAAKIVLQEPVPAPITAGQPMGTLVISAKDMPDHEIPVVAGTDVARLGAIGRMFFSLKQLVQGLI